VVAVSPKKSLLKPTVQPLPGDLLKFIDREALRRRCQNWLENNLDEVFFSLRAALSSSTLSSPARGLAFQLAENLGSLQRNSVAGLINAMGRLGRKSLKPFGIRIGRHWVFMPALLKPRAVRLRGMLWGLWNSTNVITPLPGRVSVAINTDTLQEFYGAVGYARFPNLAIRCDIVERLASIAWTLSRKGPFALDGEATQLLALAGCSTNEIVEILSVLGYRGVEDKDGKIHFNLVRQRRANPKGAASKKKNKKKQIKLIEKSPFAVLQNLMIEH